MKDTTLSDLSRQTSIKTDYPLMDFSDSSWKDCAYTGRIIGPYIIFYQCGPIEHGTHVSGPVYQSSAESDYNAACIVVMYLTHFRMLSNRSLNRDTYIVPEEASIIILDGKSAV